MVIPINDPITANWQQWKLFGELIFMYSKVFSQNDESIAFCKFIKYRKSNTNSRIQASNNLMDGL